MMVILGIFFYARHLHKKHKEKYTCTTKVIHQTGMALDLNLFERWSPKKKVNVFWCLDLNCMYKIV